MKTTAVLVMAAASLARATGGSDALEMNCEKPNANFCIAEDIILRCDANSVGIPGRCYDNLSGEPPSGGSAVCHESAQGAGDAACEKNCVVYADPPFTLPADQCTPSVTPDLRVRAAEAEQTSMPMPEGLSTVSGVMSLMDGSPSKSEATASPSKLSSLPGGASAETGRMSIPEGTSALGGAATRPVATSAAAAPSETEPDECPNLPEPSSPEQGSQRGSSPTSAVGGDAVGGGSGGSGSGGSGSGGSGGSSARTSAGSSEGSSEGSSGRGSSASRTRAATSIRQTDTLTAGAPKHSVGVLAAAGIAAALLL